MESSKPIRFQIITPEMTIYDEMVNHVVLPGQEGGVGIFHHHTPFMSYLRSGYLQIYLQDKRRISLPIGNGLMEFRDDLLTLLTTEDISVDQVDAEAPKEEVLEDKVGEDRVDIQDNV